MIRKPLQIDENRKLLQHKFSVFSQICPMMATDSLQVITHGSKSGNLTPALLSEAKP
jgi:hypothetical protein